MDFNALVIKVASRCNLNCSYCFMYNLGDETYKLQPKFMEEDTVDTILLKTKNYITKYNKKRFTFLFHGGEPLLMKPSFFTSFCEKVISLQEVLPEVKLGFGIQTNGVLIDHLWCNLLKKFNVHVGISIDGGKEAHDMYRKDHGGKGSYEAVVKGATLLRKKLGYLNLISVINVQEPVKDNYDSFKKLGASSINYLLTDYTHDNYPYTAENDETPTADWLIELFDLWAQDTTKRHIPFFSGMINILLGRDHSENNEVTSLVLETNGKIEVIDSLKACGNAFTKNNLNIKDNELSDIMNTMLGELYFKESTTKLCKKCQLCPIKEICRGGRLVHRYSRENGFNNPSVYCKDLIKIIAHIQEFLFNRFSDIYNQEEVSKINPQEIIDYLDTLEINQPHLVVNYNELEKFRH